MDAFGQPTRSQGGRSLVAVTTPERDIGKAVQRLLMYPGTQRLDVGEEELRRVNPDDPHLARCRSRGLPDPDLDGLPPLAHDTAVAPHGRG